MSTKAYLLDTDSFSYLISGRYPKIRQHVTVHQKSVFLSSITLAEALYGAKKKDSPKLLSLITLFRELFPVKTWDVTAAESYAEIRVTLEKAGHPIGNMDMMIAAVALANGLTLVTNNERHFRKVHGLQIENWTK